MEAYTNFAYVYDTFMDETPYEMWKNYIKDILFEEDIREGIVLDLGCGTGKMTRLLMQERYDMIGVDASSDMLAIAREQNEEGILYLCQDMREFELYGTVAAVISVCDCINYLTEDDDVIKTFRLVNNYLDPEGIFIFDFNTVHKYRDVIGNTVIAENRKECSFIWDNSYDDLTKINEYDLTLFIREDLIYEMEDSSAAEMEDEILSEIDEDSLSEDVEDGEDDQQLFARFMESHYQKGYELEDMKRFLSAAGMVFVKAFDTDTMGAVTDESQRVTVVAKEHPVEGKVYC